LLSARVNLISAQRDRVVASYNVLSAVGRLSPTVLGLPTQSYDPRVHYQQVGDSWFGGGTPDGRGGMVGWSNPQGVKSFPLLNQWAEKPKSMSLAADGRAPGR